MKKEKELQFEKNEIPNINQYLDLKLKIFLSNK